MLNLGNLPKLLQYATHRPIFREEIADSYERQEYDLQHVDALLKQDEPLQRRTRRSKPVTKHAHPHRFKFVRLVDTPKKREWPADVLRSFMEVSLEERGLSPRKHLGPDRTRNVG